MTAATADRRRAWRRGRTAEGLAVLLLRLKGWRVLARRYRTPVGEIDIIARRGRTLAFVEVKARDGAATAAEAAARRQRGRIERAARWFLAHHPEATANAAPIRCRPGGAVASAAAYRRRLAGGRVSSGLRTLQRSGATRFRPRPGRGYSRPKAPTRSSTHSPLVHQDRAMSLAVAIQMDPIESVNIDSDSTFVLALEAAGARARPLPLSAATAVSARGPRLCQGAPAPGAPRARQSLHAGRRGDARPRQSRRHPDAPGSALRHGLHHLDPSARACASEDAGGERPGPCAQRAREALCHAFPAS